MKLQTYSIISELAHIRTFPITLYYSIEDNLYASTVCTDTFNCNLNNRFLNQFYNSRIVASIVELQLFLLIFPFFYAFRIKELIINNQNIF